jgi:hypothetical protein
VARLFAELLEQAGARASSRFVQMTASQALRKGAKTFATDLAALTGSTQERRPAAASVAPRRQRRGRRRRQALSGRDCVRVDATRRVYDVKFTDNTVEENVARARVRPVGEGQAVGGVLFLDEAYDLDPANNADGRAILAEIMSVAEDHRDTVTIILAGYKDDIENASCTPSMSACRRASRACSLTTSPRTQLARSGARWAPRRAGASATTFRAWRRRALRVAAAARALATRARCANCSSAPMGEAKHRYVSGVPTVMIVEDVIGKEPSRENVPELDAVMRELESMVGLASVKRDMQALVDLARNNYKRELAGLKVDDVPLNRLFLGNPGVGKTTVAALYGRLLRALALSVERRAGCQDGVGFRRRGTLASRSRRRQRCSKSRKGACC